MARQIFFSFFPLLAMGSPLTSRDSSISSIDPSLQHFCALPKSLDFQGVGKPIFDCDTMDRFQSPPCYNYGYGGSYPIICCPKPKSIIFPGEPDHPDFVPDQDYIDIGEQVISDAEFCASTAGAFEYGEVNYDYVEPDYVPFNVADRCENSPGSNCTLASACGPADFSKSTPPIYCGLDESSGENKFCCSDSSGKVDSPQKPAFTLDNNEPWPCEDLTAECSRWLKNDPNVCSPSHLTFDFMRFGCMKTCNVCQDKGCVDNFESCPRWARSGVCSSAPEFMIFNCRESCGTCGYKSHYSKGGQEVDGKEYSDMNSSKFYCGSTKAKKTIADSEALMSENFNDEAKPYTYEDQIKQNKQASCTSSIISDRFVLTAAHCTTEFQSQDTTRTVIIRDDTPFEEVIEVRRYFVHPLYQFPNIPYDLAIFELERRIEYDFEKFGDSPTCLSNSFESGGIEALVQGFGKTENNSLPNVLLETKVLTMTNEECIDWIRFNATFFQDEYKKITEGILCTKGIFNEKRGIFSGPCEGDSGGPLYINSKDLPNGQVEGQTLAGIHQGGLGCGSKNYPSYWQRVSSYLPWIKCVKENAEKGLSHRDVERACNYTVRRFT